MIVVNAWGAKDFAPPSVCGRATNDSGQGGKDMHIRCWGARGSIAVSGRQYVTYGGDTTCMEIRTRSDEIIVVDAGTGIRRLGNELLAEGRLSCTMLFTHAHWDHILGFPFFKPVHQPGARITVHGCPLEQGNMQSLLGKTMAPPYFPVPFDRLLADVEYMSVCTEGQAMDLHGLEVSTIALSHPNLGQGYKFTDNGAAFVFLTDNELHFNHRGGRSYQEYVEFCAGADLLIHDAEYTEADYAVTRGWGHSTYIDALQLACDAGVRRFGLFHHNQDRHDDALERIVEHCRRILDSRGQRIACFAVGQDMAFEV